MKQGDLFNGQRPAGKGIRKHAQGTQHTPDCTMVPFDASHGQMRTKRSVLLRKPHWNHCTSDTLGQRDQAIEGSAKTNPQHAGRPIIGKHSESLKFKSKGRKMGNRRLHRLADLGNLNLRRISYKLQVKV